MAKQLNVNLHIDADTEKAKKQIQDLYTTLQKVSAQAGSSSGLFDTKNMQEASRAAQELQRHLSAAVDVNTGKLNLSAFSSSLKASGKSLGDYKKSLESMGPAGEAAFLKISKSIATADAPLRKTNAKLQEFATTLKNTVRWQFSSSLIHGFIGSVQKAYGYAQDLNDSLNKIRIVTGASVAEMDAFAEKANRAAKALSTTTTAYTDAALIFYQQGLKDDEVEERTNVTIKMAQVAGESASDVSSYMTAIWNNFADGSKELEYYGDVMAKLGAKTAASSAEIAEGLEKFASIGDTVGLSYEYATAAVATIVDKTRQGADTVGTALKTIFARLQGLQLGETLEDGVDLNKYSKALQAVGVSVLDLNGNLRDADDIIYDLGMKWETLSNAQQTALAQTVAGTRQYTQLMALMENFDAFQTNVSTAETADGTLQEQADIYAESWEAAQKRVQAAAENIYDSLIDDDFFIDLTDAFAILLEGIGGFVDGFGGMEGILFTVGSFITQKLAKEAPAALDRIKQNIMQITGMAHEAANTMQQENIAWLKQEAKSAMTSVNEGEGSMAYAAEVQMTEYIAEQKNKLIQYENQYSEAEKAAAEQEIAHLQQMSELMVQKGQRYDELNGQVLELEQSLSLMGANFSDGESTGIDHLLVQIRDLTGKSAPLRNISKQFKSLQSTVNDAGSQSAKSVENLRNKLILLAKDASRSSGDKFKAQWQDVVKQLKETEGQAELTEQQLIEMFTKSAAYNGVEEELTQTDTQLKTLIDSMSKIDGVNPNALNAFVNKLKEMGVISTSVPLQLENIRSGMANIQPHAASASEALISFSGALMQCNSFITSMKSLGEVFKDEDATTIEKIGAVTGALTATIMTFNAVSKLTTTLMALETAAKQKSAIATFLSAIAKGKEATAESIALPGKWANVTATIAQTLATWGLNAAMAPLLVVTLALTAAILILVGIFSLLANAESDEEREARRAAETQKALKEAVDETTEAYENLSAAFDDYKDLVTALEACTKGTEEWATKMGEVQQKMEDIIEEFPQLIALTNLYNDDGTFNLDTIENYIDNLEKYSRVARVANSVNAAQEIETEREETLVTQNKKDTSEIVQGYGNLHSAFSGQYDVYRSSPVQANQGQYAERIVTGVVNGLIENGTDVSSLTAEDIIRLTEESFNAQQTQYLTVHKTSPYRGAPAVSSFKMSEDQANDLLSYLQTELPALEETIAENEEESQVGKADRNTALMAANMVLDADATELERNYAATEFQEQYDSIYQDWLTKGQAWGRGEEQNDEVRQLWKDFQAATGTDYELAQNAIQGESNNRQIAYTVTKEDGSTEEKTYTLEYVAQMVATSKALEAIGTSGERVAVILNDVSTSAVQVAQANGATAEAAQQVAQGLLGFMTGDGQGNLEGLTEEGYRTLQTDIESKGGVEGYLKAAFNTDDLEALAKDLGYESAEKLIAGFQSSYDNYAVALDDIVNHLYSSAKEAFTGLQDNMGQLTLAQKRNVAEILNQAYVYGDKAGVEFVTSLMEGLQGADLAAFADALGGVVDWSTMDVATLTKILDDAGVTTDFTTGELQALIEAMSDVAMTADKAASEFAKLHKIIDGIKTGDTISQEDYLALGAGYEDYFMKMADGTYKLVGDAEEFYNAVNGQSINNFVHAVAEAQNTYDNLLTYKKSGASLEDSGLTKSSATPQMAYDNWDTNHESGWETGAVETFDPGLAQAQIEYLQTVAGYSKEQTAAWQDMVDTQTMTLEGARALADEVAKNATQWGNLDQAVLGAQADLLAAQEQLASTCTTFEELDELLRSGQISAEAYTKAFESLSNAEMTEGLDIEALEDYADYLEDLNPELKKYEGQSKKVAASIMKMNDGVDALADGFEDWSDILLNSTEGSEEYCEALSNMKDALSDLTGVSDDYISRDFIVDHMEDIEKAATGDADAIDRLKKALADEIIAKIILDNELTPEKAQEVLDAYNALQVPDVEVGVTLTGDDEFIAKLNEMILAAGMTAPQVNELLSGMGFSASFASEPQAVQVREPDIVTTHHKIENYTETTTPDGRVIPEWDDVTTTTTTPGAVHEGEVDAYALETSAPGTTVTPKIDSLTKTANGSSNNYSGSNKGGKTPGGSSNKGGSNSGDKKKNDEKHKKVDDERDRYRVIKNQLEDLTAAYDNISSAKDKAFGKARLANLQKEIEAQKKLTAANKEYLNQIETNLNSDRSDLNAAIAHTGVTATFDGNKTLTNYDEILEAAVREYNQAVDEFNRHTTDDEGAKEAFEAAQERYEEVKKALDQYDETHDLWKEQQQKVLDDIMNEMALDLEETQLKVELKIEASESQLEYLEYMFDKIENKAYDCAAAFSYLNGMTEEYEKQSNAYTQGILGILENKGLGQADLDGLIAGDQGTIDKLAGMLSSGGVADLSDGLSEEEMEAAKGFTADDVDTLKEYVSGLLEANQSLMEVRQTVHDQVLEVWDEWNEKIDAGISKIEHLQSITESYQNIIDIVGQKNLGVSNEFMSKMRQQSVDQANDKLTASKAKYDSLQASFKDAKETFEAQKAKGILSPEEIKMWEDNLRQMEEDVQSAAEEFQSSWEEALEAANAAFEAAVDQIITAYDDAAAGLMGSMAELQEAFDRKSDLSSQYLEDYEKIYQISKLNREIENSIDSTDNVKAKRELLELQSKINAYEEAGVEISEYQMEQLRQEYELKKAQIELEEAQDAKSQVQMTRDADGNYSYVYTANSEDVANAEQNYEDKLHAMQQSNAEYINDLQSNMIQMEQDYQDQVQEIMKNTSLTAEERMIKLNELNQYYDEKMKFYISEAELWEENSQRLYEEDWMNYASATGYKISEEDKWLDHWNETQLSILTGFTSLEEYHSNHNMNVSNLLLSSSDAFATWQANIEEAMNNAGTSMGTFQEDATEVLDKVAEESDETKESVVDMATDAKDAIGEVVDAVAKWEDDYSKKVQSMLAKNEALAKSFNTLLAAWSQYDDATGDDGGGDGDQGGGGDGDQGGGDNNGGGKDGGGGGGKVDNSDKAAGVAAAIWMDGGSASGWGNDPGRAKKLSEKGVTGAQAYINAHGPNGDIYADWSSKRGQLKKYYYGAFDTGGYTGEWGDDSGRFAMLHQKEIVLNEEDTSNFLKTVDIVRQIAEMIDLNAISSAGGFNSLFAATSSNLAQTLQQEVTIHAEFPNATDRDEISAAFSDLVNLASQYAHRK